MPVRQPSLSKAPDCSYEAVLQLGQLLRRASFRSWIAKARGCPIRPPFSPFAPHGGCSLQSRRAVRSGSARGGLPGSPVFPCLVASRMRLAHLGHAEDPLKWIDMPSAPAGQAPIFESMATQEPRDCFISHASEDKDAIARPLAEALTSAGYSVWFDEYELILGDSLRAKIDEGLAASRFGVVVLSPQFFEKGWPQSELNALAAKEMVGGERLILPIWHGVDEEFLASRASLACGSNRDTKRAARQSRGPTHPGH